MNSFKPIGIALAATVLLSLASCNTTPPVPENTQPSSDTATTKASSQKIIIAHYNQWGNLTGLLHSIDIGLYYASIDYILSRGGDPSPENIDKVYHGMRG